MGTAEAEDARASAMTTDLMVEVKETIDDDEEDCGGEAADVFAGKGLRESGWSCVGVSCRRRLIE
jgi:hypothetical protein